MSHNQEIEERKRFKLPSGDVFSGRMLVDEAGEDFDVERDTRDREAEQAQQSESCDTHARAHHVRASRRSPKQHWIGHNPRLDGVDGSYEAVGSRCHSTLIALDR